MGSSARRDYGFPYEPYSIQFELMDKIYESIEDRKLAIIESPTGTGKSLSIICAMFKWIEDYKNHRIDELSKQIKQIKLNGSSSLSSSSPTKVTNSNELDWIQEQVNEKAKFKEIDKIKKLQDNFNKHIEYSKVLKKSRLKPIRNFPIFGNDKNKQILASKKRDNNDFEDCESDKDLLIDYDEEDSILDSILKNDTNEQKNENYYKPKIYYCSRTHSQLSQFVNEIKKTKYYQDKSDECSRMLVTLSSRMNYCINTKVNRFNNINIINEKCNELNSTKSRCSFYNHDKLNDFNQNILGDVMDLEDIVRNGNRLQTCPYFSTKLAVHDAEVVVLPYNILFHHGTREKFNIDLQDSIVIVDEAHNLLETIASVYSVEIFGKQMKCLVNCLRRYLNKYLTKFNPINKKHLEDIIDIVERFIRFMNQELDDDNIVDVTRRKNTGKKPEQYSIDSFDFVIKLGLEKINVFNLLKFIDQSHLAAKLYMFSLKPKDAPTENIQENVTKKAKTSNGTLEFLNKIKNQQNKSKKNKNCENIQDNKQDVKDSVVQVDDEELLEYNSNYMYVFKEFLQALKDVKVNGKVLVDLKGNGNVKESSFKYVLLSASSHFKDILQKCRSVILCGGTMKPFDDYINQLFKPLNIPNSMILTHSCDHVIPANNLVAIGCGKSPQNYDLNYSFKSRNLEQTIKQTGLTIVELCKVIPKGMVVFFPSYDYMELVMKNWLRLGIMHQLSSTKKRVFKEQRNSAATSGLLLSYSKFINAEKDNGAVLFSVIGGKMSEGINFSDNLGRGVVVIGLPYANRNSLELTAKMDYLSKFGDNVANEYYENLCMRAVNQSIGRAIRHKNDYATIVLLDDRYCHKKVVQDKLPDWIKSRFKTVQQFDSVLHSIRDFFHDKTLA